MAEGVGTGLLVCVVFGSGIMGQTLSQGNDAIALLANSLATAAGLFVLIEIFGPVSGAHFNPVVSASAWAQGGLNGIEALWRMLFQLLGGLLGVGVTHLMFSRPIVEISTHVRDGLGLQIGELVATFGLMLTIHSVGRSAPSRVSAAVALYIGSAYWFISSTSFANPAITIARMFTDSFAGIAPGSVPGFIAAQVMGGGLAWVYGRRFTSTP